MGISDVIRSIERDMYSRLTGAQNCSTCKYGHYDEMQGYVCVNGNSEYVADFVDAEHVCEDYEGKDDDL